MVGSARPAIEEKDSAAIRPQTAAKMVALAAARYDDHVAYIEEGRSTTLGDHVRDARRLGSILSATLGVSPGDRVAVLAATTRAHLALWHAAVLGYFTLVPLNFRLAAAELQVVLANAGPHLLIYEDQFSSLANEVILGLPSNVTSVRMQDLSDAALLGEILAVPDPSGDDIAVIMYTSGTTGLPKGVEFGQRSLALTNTRQHEFWDIRRPGTCLYTTTPLFHVSAIFAVLGPALEGNQVVLAQQFDIDRLLEDSRRHKITHVALVAVMIERFLHHPNFLPSEHAHLRYIIYGGSPVPLSTINELSSKLPDADLIQSYGMTEALGAATLLTGNDHRRGGERLKSCGIPLSGVEIRIRGEDGQLCRPQKAGEIELKSDAMLSGYRDNPEATKASLADGWFRTGDVGNFDSDGYLYVIDRLKDMIISGGENIYSQEVEHCLSSYPGVAQVAVIGIPSEVWGEQVHAVIVPNDGVLLEPADIASHLKTKLAAYKRPKSYKFITGPLPLTGSNKVNKRVLRQEYLDGRSLEK